MEQHTSGPWAWDGDVTHYDTNIEAPWLLGSDGFSPVLSGEIHGYSKADARLIAAAPELLEALQAVEGTLSVFVAEGTAAPDSVIGKNLLRVRAAIAKASA